MALSNAHMWLSSANIDGSLLGMIDDIIRRERISEADRVSLIKQARDKTGHCCLSQLQHITANEEREAKFYELYLVQSRVVGLDFFGIKSWAVELQSAVEEIRLDQWSIAAFTLGYMALRSKMMKDEMFVTSDWRWTEVRKLFQLGDRWEVKGITFLVNENEKWKVARLEPMEEDWTYGLVQSDPGGIDGLSKNFADYIAAATLCASHKTDQAYEDQLEIIEASPHRHFDDGKANAAWTWAEDGLLLMARIFCLMSRRPVTEAEGMIEDGFEMQLLEAIRIAMKADLNDIGLGSRGYRVADVEKMRHHLQKKQVKQGKYRQRQATVYETREDPLADSDEETTKEDLSDKQRQALKDFDEGMTEQERASVYDQDFNTFMDKVLVGRKKRPHEESEPESKSGSQSGSELDSESESESDSESEGESESEESGSDSQ